MADNVQQLADWLMTDAKSKGKSIRELKDKSYKDSLKDIPQKTKKGLTETAYLKSRRLAERQMVREQLQSLVDDPQWTKKVTAVFPDASFRLENKGHHRMIIEVN